MRQPKRVKSIISGDITQSSGPACDTLRDRPRGERYVHENTGGDKHRSHFVRLQKEGNMASQTTRALDQSWHVTSTNTRRRWKHCEQVRMLAAYSGVTRHIAPGTKGLKVQVEISRTKIDGKKYSIMRRTMGNKVQGGRYSVGRFEHPDTIS